MDRIEDFQAFVAVVERGSLTGAARHLGRSLQSVSRSLAAVERECGVELVHRTTRRSSPTEAGHSFYRRLGAALAEIEAAKREASSGGVEPSGRLRVSASPAFAPLYLVPVVSAFLAQFPRIDLELDLSDRYVDLVADGYDLAVRIGQMPDSTLKVKGLGNLRRVFFGAPSYFAKHGCPKRPGDLIEHQCIVRTAAREGNAWPFVIGGKLKTIKVGGRFRTSGALAANQAAAEGLGIASAPLWQVRELVDDGRVELILIGFEPPPVPLRAVWSATGLLPAKTQAFVDFLAVRLRAERL